jgi:peptidoglycan/LPS O-acetylase OafA/YrhL
LCLPFAHHYINNGKKVSLKKYYVRRLTRIEPPYIIALTGIFIVELLVPMYSPGVLVPHWLASLAYVHNILYHHASILTVVAWSLEVEIQFYLLAPVLFSVLLLPHISRRVILVAATIATVYFQHLHPMHFYSILKFAQYFFIGILLADFYVSNTAADLVNSKWMLFPAVICLVALLYIPLTRFRYPDRLLWAQLTFPFLVGLFFYTVLKNDSLKKAFSYKFIPIIGGMCYSIYLLHYTIISIFGRVSLGFHITAYYLPNLLLQIVILSIPVLLLSGMYYYYIERPFMSTKWLNMLVKKDKKAEEMNLVSEDRH